MLALLGLFTECTTTQNVCKCIVTSDTYASSEYNRMPKIGGWMALSLCCKLFSITHIFEGLYYTDF